MQTEKPEKIIGKKYVRGKPYYKVKWEGQSKDKATWESPPRLKEYKTMVQQYEVKNWGVPLDVKFFEQDLYLTKCFVSNVKSMSKKSVKIEKKMKKAKIQQPDSSLSQQEEPESENDCNKDEKNELGIKNATVIDVDDHCESEKQKNESDKSDMFKLKSMSCAKETKQNVSACYIDMMSLNLKNKQQGQKQAEFDQTQRILNQQSMVKTSSPKLTDQQVQTPSEKPTNCLSNISKKFSLGNCINISIFPYRPIKHIENIYHLTKLDSGNHLYLVQFERKEMKKYNTSQLLESHPSEFVQFLESQFKAQPII